ncbi:MAG: hypothetical protein ACPGU1_20675 [Myxococcota bacterium]
MVLHHMARSGITVAIALLAFGCSATPGEPLVNTPEDFEACGPESPCPEGSMCVAGACEVVEAPGETDQDAVEVSEPDVGGGVDASGPDAAEPVEPVEPEEPGQGSPCADVDCPEGSHCEITTGSDTTCVVDSDVLCAPCVADADCPEGLCVAYTGQGRFCSASCGGDADCPSGYVCDLSDSDAGGQCMHASGACECSEASIVLGRAAGCSVTNEFGTCDGVRICGEAGLSDCDAQTPADETCNGLDDDCDGVTDDVTCEDGNPCTTDSCAGEAGCAFEPTVGEPCDDEQVDTANDVCQADGSCGGEAIVCPTGPCVQDAAPDGVTCKTAYLAEGSPCDDGDGSTENDACTVDGTCVGTPVVCEPGLCEVTSVPGDGGCEVVYEAPGTLCDDGDLSTGADSCDGAGGCAGVPLECPAEDTCVLSSAADGVTCDVVYAEEGTACDDGKLETSGDRCDGAGTCAGTGYTCAPGPCELKSIPNGVDCDIVLAPVGSTCDDGANDTQGDTCDEAGVCAGTAYTCEAGPCALSSVPNGVDCDVVPLAPGTGCDDLDDTTKGDACDAAGECVGEAYECALGPCDMSSEPDGVGCVVISVAPGALCDDGDPATKDDVCDGESLCLGTSYSCEPTQCEASSVPNGVDCDVVAEAAGLTCNDEDMTTSGDVCDGLGECVGADLACEASACELSSEPDGVGCTVTYVEAGELCDDGVDETVDDACDGAGVCTGEATSCVPSQCELTSVGEPGACEVTYADSGTACDDGDLATSGDSCDGAGACLGEPLVCEPGVCELFSAPDGQGCLVTFAGEGAVCDDGDVATVLDTCDGAGGCTGVAPMCGDGVVEGLEACEPEDDASLSCVYGEVACEVCLECQWGPGEVVGSCGDGITQSDFEDCDDGNGASGDGCLPDCTLEPSGPSMTVGGTASSWTQGGHFRGNVFDWQESKFLQSFDVYLTFPSSCELGLYVHEVHGKSKTVIWSATFSHPSSSGFINSGHVGVPFEAGARYGLGVGWTCSAGYYGSTASCDDYGPMQGVVSYWDNSYGGYSPDYAPPNEGGGCSIVYYQNFYFN